MHCELWIPIFQNNYKPVVHSFVVKNTAWIAASHFLLTISKTIMFILSFNLMCVPPTLSAKKASMVLRRSVVSSTYCVILTIHPSVGINYFLQQNYQHIVYQFLPFNVTPSDVHNL